LRFDLREFVQPQVLFSINGITAWFVARRHVTGSRRCGGPVIFRDRSVMDFLTARQKAVSPRSLHSRPRSTCEISCCAISSKLQTKPAKRWLAANPTLPMPSAVLNRAKTEFFTTAVQAWLQKDERLHQWRRVPSFVVTGYPWARRWAYQVARG
jgi:hypothetical protein